MHPQVLNAYGKYKSSKTQLLPRHIFTSNSTNHRFVWSHNLKWLTQKNCVMPFERSIQPYHADCDYIIAERILMT